jgi:hypothetical protein
MKPLSKKEKEKILSRLFWDRKTNHTDLDKFLDEKLDTIYDIDSQAFIARLLTSCNWYTLLKLLPPPKLSMLLIDSVLDRLFPKDLKEKYIYARDVLSRHAISISR